MATIRSTIESDSFISSYKFEDKKLSIYKKFLDAQKLPDCQDKNLIMEDLVLQMEHLVNSNPNQFWFDFFKVMTSYKSAPCQSVVEFAPNWRTEISKFLEYRHQDTNPHCRPDSKAKLQTSSNKHPQKLEMALQKFMVRKNERERNDQYMREFENSHDSINRPKS